MGMELPVLNNIATENGDIPSPRRYHFTAQIRERGLDLSPVSIETLQVNIGKLCNQACRHCHVDASPLRTEIMDQPTAERCIQVLAENPEIRNLDITGGAPELNENFDWMVTEGRRLGRNVMVRHNLTVQFDGNPQTHESKEHLPAFFAEQGCEVICSLPYYAEYFTDKQRGRGVFDKSIEGLRRLNAVGYGRPGSGLVLNLVYNPVGAFLPAAQAGLEVDFKRELLGKFGIVFNSLYAITNMPIHRFKEDLLRHGGYEDYMNKLVTAFNPTAAMGVMCRSLVSVDYDGRLSDCDFNQMLDIPLHPSAPQTIFDWKSDRIGARPIVFADHCFGCTAGGGSSCGGATA